MLRLKNLNYIGASRTACGLTDLVDNAPANIGKNEPPTQTRDNGLVRGSSACEGHR